MPARASVLGTAGGRGARAPATASGSRRPRRGRSCSRSRRRPGAGRRAAGGEGVRAPGGGLGAVDEQARAAACDGERGGALERDAQARHDQLERRGAPRRADDLEGGLQSQRVEGAALGHAVVRHAPAWSHALERGGARPHLVDAQHGVVDVDVRLVGLLGRVVRERTLGRRDEAQRVAGREERRRRATRIEQPGIGGPEHPPTAGAGARVDAGLAVGDGDRTGRHARLGALAARERQRLGEAVQVREAGREADERDGVRGPGVRIDQVAPGPAGGALERVAVGAVAVMDGSVRTALASGRPRHRRRPSSRRPAGR
jgi:hypothetical protein